VQAPVGRVEAVRGPQVQPYAPDPNRRNVHAAAYSDLFGGLWNELPGVYMYGFVYTGVYISSDLFFFMQIFSGVYGMNFVVVCIHVHLGP
jgi:hypothetical protein